MRRITQAGFLENQSDGKQMKTNRVITFVADANYLPHAKSFMVNCRRQGNWQGDFCLIFSGNDCSEIEQREIDIFKVPEGQWNFMVKFWAFTSHFHCWDKCLCIDLDMLVQDDLNLMFDRLARNLPAILCDQEDGTILGGLQNWDKEHKSHQDVYTKLKVRFPHVTSQMFNAGFIFYSPATIPKDTRDRLLKLDEEFRVINPARADQMLLNLLLYDRLKPVGKDATCFFGHDYPGNRVPSEGRGWTGDEIPAVLHYTRWYAPWIVKQSWQPQWGMTEQQKKELAEHGTQPEMGGYRNHRLNRICHELYAENLAAFDEEFPRQ